MARTAGDGLDLGHGVYVGVAIAAEHHDGLPAAARVTRTLTARKLLDGLEIRQDALRVGEAHIGRERDAGGTEGQAGRLHQKREDRSRMVSLIGHLLEADHALAQETAHALAHPDLKLLVSLELRDRLADGERRDRKLARQTVDAEGIAGAPAQVHVEGAHGWCELVALLLLDRVRCLNGRWFVFRGRQGPVSQSDRDPATLTGPASRRSDEEAVDVLEPPGGAAHLIVRDAEDR